MTENKMSELIRASVDGIKEFADVDAVFGKAVTTPSGVTVIPVSRISVGFATGGVDYQAKRPIAPTNFGGGSGTGISVVPVAFLTVGSDADIRLVKIGADDGDAIKKAIDLIEASPVIIEKIKNAIKG